MTIKCLLTLKFLVTNLIVAGSYFRQTSQIPDWWTCEKFKYYFEGGMLDAMCCYFGISQSKYT